MPDSLGRLSIFIGDERAMRGRERGRERVGDEGIIGSGMGDERVRRWEMGLWNEREVG